MNELYIQMAAIVTTVIFSSIIVIQVLLALGLTSGEITMGGYYPGVLPKKLRIVALISALIILFFGLIILQHARVFSIGFTFISTNILVWVFTVYLGLNTIANFSSKSKKEKMIMTPLSGLAFLLCLFIVLYA